MKRSKFSLSHYKLLSCDMGELVPIGLTEVLPGDTIQQASSLLVRVSPLLAPVMHPVHVRIHHWFVPHRIIWDGWEDFITGGPDGMDDAVLPYIDTANLGPGGAAVGSLADYLGIPPGVQAAGSVVSALPFRGYNLIWNEWYRDQDLQQPLPISTEDGVDSITPTGMQNVCWEKDYFTTARPFTQKGPEVTVPFGLFAPVIPDGTRTPVFSADNGVTGQVLVGSSSSTSVSLNSAAGADDTLRWKQSGLQVDLAGATAVSINDLRTAFAVQRYQEARARYGSRYTEYLRFLGVKSSDARLQRPEYLGGGRQTIQFSEILQTGPDDAAGGGVGALKGHGIGAVRSNRYRRFFEEHGYIFSLMSVKPKTMYAQGLARHWSRRNKEEFFQRELQHIGQQEVFNREIYAGHSTPAGVFGYQDRYDEYRRMESSIAGDFRDKLDFWHYARIFGGDVSLNADFVKSVPTKRPNAVESEDVLWIMANHSIQARRLVSGAANSFIF